MSGLEQVSASSASNSDSRKVAIAECPAGKKVVGTGADIVGGKTGFLLNELTDVVIDSILVIDSPSTGAALIAVEVTAFEEEPTNDAWSVVAFAICANAS